MLTWPSEFSQFHPDPDPGTNFNADQCGLGAAGLGVKLQLTFFIYFLGLDAENGEVHPTSIAFAVIQVSAGSALPRSASFLLCKPASEYFMFASNLSVCTEQMREMFFFNKMETGKGKFFAIQVKQVVGLPSL